MSLRTILQGKKTELASVSTIIATISAFASGEVTLVQAAQVAVPALLALTLGARIKRFGLG